MGPLCIPRPPVPHPPPSLLASRSIIGERKTLFRGKLSSAGGITSPLSWESPRRLPCIVSCLQSMNKHAVHKTKTCPHHTAQSHNELMC